MVDIFIYSAYYSFGQFRTVTWLPLFPCICQALTKFLKCVNWSQTQEVKQALELLQVWSPMDVEDALELLTPTFSHPAVRKYAVNRLRQADDEVEFI